MIFCPIFRMKRANSLNVLNVGARESQDGAQVRRRCCLPILVITLLITVYELNSPIGVTTTTK